MVVSITKSAPSSSLFFVLFCFHLYRQPFFLLFLYFPSAYLPFCIQQHVWMVVLCIYVVVTWSVQQSSRSCCCSCSLILTTGPEFFPGRSRMGEREIVCLCNGEQKLRTRYNTHRRPPKSIQRALSNDQVSRRFFFRLKKDQTISISSALLNKETPHSSTSRPPVLWHIDE